MGLFNGMYKNYGFPKDKVLEWQSLVTGTRINNVRMTKQQLVSATEMIVDSHRKIIADCVRLVNETLTPSVFFDRYDLLIEEMYVLIPFEPFYNFSQSIKEQAIDLQEKREQNEKAFINKIYLSTVEAAKSLKTEKGRQARIDKFFDIMLAYKNRMHINNWEYLCTLKQ